MRLILLLLAALSAWAQRSADPERFRQAGVCARCHVAQVLEWSTSRHQGAGVACQGCHGPSAAHVANEKNDVKPDRLPRGAAIRELCASCHAQGCPRTGRKDDCASCHHAHALFDPNRNQELASVRIAEDDRVRRLDAHLKQGETLLAAADWRGAADQFQAALRLYPGHRRAAARLALAKRRLDPKIPGFELLDAEFDPETGLPLHVRIAGLPIEMVLVAGGDADLGSDALPSARPAHTVTLAPFYLARTELTQRAWLVLQPDNPSTHRGEDLPVHNVSWNDAQQWIGRLNQRVAGGEFRLPTEAEWEFAARSGSGQANLRAVAWFRDSSAPADSAAFRELDAYAPRPVATRAPDRRGIYDLLGNVWEWCSSWMRPYPYEPRDGRESLEGAGVRVLRGGGFADSADYLVPWFRHGDRPARRLPFNGVRLARSVPR